MEYIPIERTLDSFQQPVALEHMVVMWQRAFGREQQIASVRELEGGLYNNTYLIQSTNMAPVILRVSPHPARQFRSERNLMRNEHASLPFLAPIAPLLPKTLAIDFTRQIIERDYLFQTYMDGEQWAQVMDHFTSEENKMLWRQLGVITRQIHTVQGDAFGSTVIAASKPSWSLVVLDWLITIVQDSEDAQLDATDIRHLFDIAQAHREILDEITCPQLLHGDLWTVNLLVKRDEEGPRIVAVLDSDRMAWGDPLADWTMFLLQRNAGTEVDAFWETYGRPEKSPGAQFRNLMYQGKYLGGARLEHYRLHHPASVQRSYQDMRIVIEALEHLLLFMER